MTVMRVHICHYTDIFMTDANLELFGSSANGFSSYRSDLDVCLTLPQFESETVRVLYVKLMIFS